jgi:uncharacterized protein with GYD domain
MPTYIVLLNLTQQGIQNVKDGPGVLDSSKQRSLNLSEFVGA